MSKELDLDEFLGKWDETKKEISILEKKIEKYKKVAEKLMEEQNTQVLSGKGFTLTKKSVTRRTVTKNNLPEELWNKYSYPSTSNFFYLSEKKEKSDKSDKYDKSDKFDKSEKIR